MRCYACYSKYQAPVTLWFTVCKVLVTCHLVLHCLWLFVTCYLVVYCLQSSSHRSHCGGLSALVTYHLMVQRTAVSKVLFSHRLAVQCLHSQGISHLSIFTRYHPLFTLWCSAVFPRYQSPIALQCSVYIYNVQGISRMSHTQWRNVFLAVQCLLGISHLSYVVHCHQGISHLSPCVAFSAGTSHLLPCSALPAQH